MTGEFPPRGDSGGASYEITHPIAKSPVGRGDDWDDGTVNHAASSEWNSGAQRLAWPDNPEEWD